VNRIDAVGNDVAVDAASALLPSGSEETDHLLQRQYSPQPLLSNGTALPHREIAADSTEGAADVRICENCGTSWFAGNSFCTSCGRRVTSIDVEADKKLQLPTRGSEELQAGTSTPRPASEPNPDLFMAADGRDQAQGLPPAGWYEDYTDASLLRYWDGQEWTTNTSPRVQMPPGMDESSTG
jgi:hypothetical protein